jgi:hypothetical protein
MNTKANDGVPGMDRDAATGIEGKVGRRDSAVKRGKKKAPQKYYLHVYSDGREKRYRKPPLDVPTLTVEIITDLGIERTWTRRAYDDENARWVTVTPRGVGWEYEQPTEDRSDSWVREVQS